MRYVGCLVLAALSGVATGQPLPEETRAMKTLTVEEAVALAKGDGRLDLNGLTTLSPEAARAFSTYAGTLHLDGLTTLSEQAAKGLDRDGETTLKGLTTLKKSAAELLRKQKRVLLPDHFK